MPSNKRIPKEIKDEILTAISQGEKVMHLADRYAVSTKTIYLWLRKQTETRGGNVLELGRLKRENEALKYLLGEYALELKTSGKKRARRGL